MNEQRGNIVNAGVLIIGSLFWDSKPHRIKWRDSYLDVRRSMKVISPIFYGRLSESRGSTYTMTFRNDESVGRSIFVPFVSHIKTTKELIDMATALWDAEQAKDVSTGTIGSSWGVVGALFKDECKLANEWTGYFQSQIKKKRINLSSMPYVKGDGFLDVPWPKYVRNRKPIDMDIIFATVTEPEKILPVPQQIAEAWINQNDGYEEYFFNNILSDIRTPEDLDIWKIIKAQNPVWLTKDEYTDAIALLDMELEENG